MEDATNLYRNQGGASPLKHLTLKSGYNTDAPESIIGPDTKRQINDLDKMLKRQKVYGIFIAICFMLPLFVYIPYDILKSR